MDQQGQRLYYPEPVAFAAVDVEPLSGAPTLLSVSRGILSVTLVSVAFPFAMFDVELAPLRFTQVPNGQPVPVPIVVGDLEAHCDMVGKEPLWGAVGRPPALGAILRVQCLQFDANGAHEQTPDRFYLAVRWPFLV